MGRWLATDVGLNWKIWTPTIHSFNETAISAAQLLLHCMFWGYAYITWSWCELAIKYFPFKFFFFEFEFEIEFEIEFEFVGLS